MKLMITPSEVAVLAFGGEHMLPAGILDDTAIVSAQQKFLAPVLGTLWGALDADRHTVLINDYLKPALAQWVRFLILPAVSAQTGAAGVVQYGGQLFTAAEDKALARLLRRVRGNAEALTGALVEHIESRPDDYPEYDPAENIRNRVSIDGGIVL